MYVTLAMSGQMQSLKNIDQSRPWVMRTYYSSQVCITTWIQSIWNWYSPESSAYCMHNVSSRCIDCVFFAIDDASREGRKSVPDLGVALERQSYENGSVSIALARPGLVLSDLVPIKSTFPCRGCESPFRHPSFSSSSYECCATGWSE